MEYELMGEPFDFEGFVSLTKKQAEAYFQWYLGQIDGRIHQLESYIKDTSNCKVIFDYSVESLIPLWEWYETKIIVEEMSQDEIEEELEGRPDWMQAEILKDTTKISIKTWAFGMDIAMYFAEVFIKHNPSVKWGYFTKPKSRVSLNRPVLLGFVGGKDLDPRRIVVNCTYRSIREKKMSRLYDLYYVWQGAIIKS